MIGRSPAFRTVLALIDKMARYDAPALIEGETGTGKELAARAIHYGSRRRDRPFVPVNCGALPDTLIENELFGHRRGAFTDAREDYAGLVALADSGTLFLDEIDTLTPRGQVTLLRFLQDHHYRPLGGRGPQAVDVRVIAATNVDLARAATEGRFRQDLLYRLNLLYLRLPPLRERHGDPPLLADHFLDAVSARFHVAKRPLHDATLRWFDAYAWPGNVRELENVVSRALLLTDDPVLRIAAPPDCAADASSDAPRSYRESKARAVAAFEVRFLTQLMARTQGNITIAAALVGTERRHLGRLLKRHGLDGPARL
jgi:DNA-binding NtrC family response regulator